MARNIDQPAPEQQEEPEKEPLDWLAHKRKIEREQREQGSFKRFTDILEEIERSASQVIQDAVDPEAARMNRFRFLDEVEKLSARAGEARSLLEEAARRSGHYIEGVSQLSANTTFGRVCAAGESRQDSYSTGYYRKMDQATFDAHQEEWIQFLEEFFDNAKKIRTEFEAMDQLNHGNLSGALREMK